jgi:hypothetical protein
VHEVHAYDWRVIREYPRLLLDRWLVAVARMEYACSLFVSELTYKRAASSPDMEADEVVI